MLTALVLICSISVTPDIRDCNRMNAVDVMRVPADPCEKYGDCDDDSADGPDDRRNAIRAFHNRSIGKR